MSGSNIRASQAGSSQSGSADQDAIDDEVQDFLNSMARRAWTLACRTDRPIELVHSLAVGAAVLVGHFMKDPSEAEVDELEEVMVSLSVASGGILRGSVERPRKRRRFLPRRRK